MGWEPLLSLTAVRPDFRLSMESAWLCVGRGVVEGMFGDGVEFFTVSTILVSSVRR